MLNVNYGSRGLTLIEIMAIIGETKKLFAVMLSLVLTLFLNLNQEPYVIFLMQIKKILYLLIISTAMVLCIFGLIILK
jgi:hypothetical protein